MRGSKQERPHAAARVDCNAAVMVSFSPPESREGLRQRLAAIQSALVDFEERELILYQRWDRP